MSGPYADKVAQQHALFLRSGVAPLTTGKALDLGSGPGSQSIALAQLGFSITAIDANGQLLEELGQHAAGLPIRTVQHDLCALATCPALPAQIDAAVCVGDIIPHLPSRECITTLFKQVSALFSVSWVVSQLEAQNFVLLSQEQTAGVWIFVASRA
jgi:2-polyprenyl-3-methyl-5-hydroxy-6-metoxy-1,4-benzoquinol methylase